MSTSAASKSAASMSSRAMAMFGAGPTTSQPRSSRISAVNGPTTGESSMTRIRRPARSDVPDPRCSVDESGDDIAVGTRHLHLRSRIEHEEAFAVGMRLHLPHEVEVDDGRAVDALEAPRVEPFFQVLHGFPEDQSVVAGLDAHVVPGGVDALDAIDVDPENLPLVLD